MFMKKFFVLAIGLIIFLLINFEAKSQVFNPGIPCLHDCPFDNWTPPTTAILALPGGCLVRVTYQSRVACNSINDVYIKSYQILTPGCNYYPISSILNKITVQLFLLNPMGLPYLTPTPNKRDTCFFPVRLVKPACWKEVDTVFFRGCDSLACCIDEYRVCYDSLLRRSFTLVTNMITAPCIDTTYHSYCTEVCANDTAFFKDTVAHDSLLLFKRINDNFNIKIDNQNHNVKLTFSNSDYSFINVEVFDFKGERIVTLENNFYNQGYHEINRQMKKLTAGMYYIVFSSGKEKITQKVIITE